MTDHDPEHDELIEVIHDLEDIQEYIMAEEEQIVDKVIKFAKELGLSEEVIEKWRHGFLNRPDNL